MGQEKRGGVLRIPMDCIAKQAKQQSESQRKRPFQIDSYAQKYLCAGHIGGQDEV